MGHGGNVIEELTADHREVDALFARLEMPTLTGDERRAVTDQAITELVRHSVAEEAYLYPAVRKAVPGGDELAEREISEHAEAEELMKRLEGLDVGDAEFEPTLRRLMQAIRHHVAEEEGVLFPKLAANTTAEDLDDLGDQVRRMKAMAPTRPHPSAPDRPPLNKILAPGAGLVDRVRDKFTGRGRAD